jgi:hypothetical protein
MWKIPGIEEIYNEYHKQTFFIRNGVYPRTIKNFENLYNDQRKVDYIKYFITFLERNRDTVDWKLYILALAKVLRNSFELKHLGKFGANKIYRDYVKSLQIEKNNIDEIYQEIINSITILSGYLKENELKWNDYLELDNNIIPVVLKHLYAGSVSLYFYACFPEHVLNKWFNYSEDCFQELFKLSKYEFLNTYIISKRNIVLSNIKTQKLITTLEQKFNKYF